MRYLLLVCALMAAACGGNPLEAEPVDCPPDAEVPRYGDLSAVTSCTGCHATVLTGPARNGAPAPINYDTHAEASRAALVGLGAMSRGTMPPGAPLDDDAITQWRIWSQCGQPE